MCHIYTPILKLADMVRWGYQLFKPIGPITRGIIYAPESSKNQFKNARHHSTSSIIHWKPIGPVHQFLSSCFQRQLPVAFLHVYVVTNQEDAALLKALCKKHHEPIPDVIIYPLTKIMYDDLDKDSRVDPGAVEALSKENPTLANVLVDYFELHKFGKMNIYACT